MSLVVPGMLVTIARSCLMRALKRVEKLMTYAQKQPEDYTKEEMRKLIEKEEKEVISTLTATVGLSSVLILLGIPKL